MRVDQNPGKLARLERPNGEHVGRASSRARAAAAAAVSGGAAAVSGGAAAVSGSPAAAAPGWPAPPGSHTFPAPDLTARTRSGPNPHRAIAASRTASDGQITREALRASRSGRASRCHSRS